MGNLRKKRKKQMGGALPPKPKRTLVNPYTTNQPVLPGTTTNPFSAPLPPVTETPDYSPTTGVLTDAQIAQMKALELAQQKKMSQMPLPKRKGGKRKKKKVAKPSMYKKGGFLAEPSVFDLDKD